MTKNTPRIQAILELKRTQKTVLPGTTEFVKQYVIETLLGDSTDIEIDQELQMEFPDEWSQAQDIIMKGL
jgi:hypothetical protein